LIVGNLVAIQPPASPPPDSCSVGRLLPAYAHNDYAVYRMLLEAGVDLIGTEDLTGTAELLSGIR
jgi:hypothetical protein